ncbi:MAG: S-layer homology domain-containing protein, partial [Oscillospiraceae bacterium]|nr:S-layer homology domain-containing protein [Oscillospiraceae bacterium]
LTDISNYAWAEDAINELEAAGRIKGTSASTFSPTSNITRADFAALLVRAFKLTSDNTENFADVTAADYFAPELAIARNTGIVSGIGDNKYAPRNPITRQDMMVIVYRALQKQGVEFGVYDEPQYEDFDAVADYARDAVTNLIGAGLVNGRNNLIAPTDYTTRAEVAVLVKRIMDYTKK